MSCMAVGFQFSLVRRFRLQKDLQLYINVCTFYFLLNQCVSSVVHVVIAAK